jgi:hypothetical protein
MFHLVLLLICLLLYFFPTIVATSKEKQNSGAIFALNLLLGWTILGWVAALVWALSKDVGAGNAPIPTKLQTNVEGARAVSPQKKCPDCAELVLIDARKCRFCGYQF